MLKINYYILCYGDKYLDKLINFSLPSFFKKKPSNFDSFKHTIILFTDKSSLKKSYQRKISNFFYEKQINYKLLDFKTHNKNKSKKISVWRLLGFFQKEIIMHAYKTNSLCVQISPDEIHSINLWSVILDKITHTNMIVLPSNEILIDYIKKDLIRLQKNNIDITEDVLLKIKFKSLKKSYYELFFNNNFYKKHCPRYYFQIGNNIYYKNIHLSPIALNPKACIKNSLYLNFKNIYNFDTSLGNKFLNQYTIYPQEALLLSLEDTKDQSDNIFRENNLFFLFFKRIYFQLIFVITNVDGINSFNYLKTFSVNNGFKNNINLNIKYFFNFFLFSYINFFFSVFFFVVYLFLKITKKFFLFFIFHKK